MQKIIYIDGKYTNEVDIKLSEGWKVISVNPVSSHTDHTYHFGAYVVLEKPENNSNNNHTTIERLAEIKREVAYKQFWDPEVMV